MKLSENAIRGVRRRLALGHVQKHAPIALGSPSLRLIVFRLFRSVRADAVAEKRKAEKDGEKTCGPDRVRGARHSGRRGRVRPLRAFLGRGGGFRGAFVRRGGRDGDMGRENVRRGALTRAV